MIEATGQVHECSGVRFEEDILVEEMGIQCYAVPEGRKLQLVSLGE
jgi:hypothetical protein